MFLDLLETASPESLISDLQLRAREKALKVGFPTRKTEDFKYFPVKDLQESEMQFSKDGYHISIEGEGVELLSHHDALEKYGIVIRNRFEKMLAREESFFSLLNSGCSDDTVCIFVNDSTDLVTIVEQFENNDTLFCPRLQFFVGKGVETSFHHQIEVKGERNCINRSVDVSVEKNAKVTFFETSTIDHENSLFLDTRVTVKEDASFTHKSGTVGCKRFRNEIRAYLLEERANCNLIGFWNGTGDANISHLVHISHLAEYTTSREHYQGVSDQKARASFEGQIYVDKVAQKTDSYQLSKHLLIGEDARGFSKPNLEVFADDVIASHGATVSMLNEEELFYLTSRGISKDVAALLLKRGFLAFFLDEIGEKQVCKSFTRLIEL